MRAAGQDADHSMEAIRHLDGLADDRRVAAQSLAPEPIAQHDHRGRAGLVVANAKRAAKQWLHAERIEVVRGHDASLHALRLAAPQKVERHRVILGQCIERARLRAQVGEFLDGEPGVRDLARRDGLLNADDTFAIRERRS